MSKKVNPKHMSAEELEQYTKTLPEKIPPKWSSVGWTAGFGAVLLFIFFTYLNIAGFGKAWVFLAASIGAFVLVGILIYKILTFGKDK